MVAFVLGLVLGGAIMRIKDWHRKYNHQYPELGKSSSNWITYLPYNFRISVLNFSYRSLCDYSNNDILIFLATLILILTIIIFFSKETAVDIRDRCVGVHPLPSQPVLSVRL